MPRSPDAQPAPKRRTAQDHRSPDAKQPNNDFKKAEKYKKTRRYYKDYRAAQLTGKRGRARKELDRRGARNRANIGRAKAGLVMAYHAGIPLGMLTAPDSKRIIALQKQLEPSERRADKVAQGVYGAHMDRLWDRGGKFYPKGAKQPKTRFTADDEVYAATPQGKQGKRPVIFTRGTTRAYAGDKKYRKSQDYATTVPLHEWTHVFQSPKLKTSAQERKLFKKAYTLPPDERGKYISKAYRYRRSSKRRTEGGAEAFEQIVAPKVAKHKAVTSKQYAPLAKWARTKKGRRWILKGQFK